MVILRKGLEKTSMKWKKLGEKIVYNGWRGILQKTFVLPNNQETVFDIVLTDTFVTIMAFTSEQEAILVKQFRPGPEMHLISFPEGMIENDEKPEVAAARELLEETGYVAGSFVFLKEFRSSYTTERQICLLALDCQKKEHQNLDNTEFIEVFLLSIEKFKSLLINSHDCSFTNVGAGFLALKYLGHFDS